MSTSTKSSETPTATATATVTATPTQYTIPVIQTTSFGPGSPIPYGSSVVVFVPGVEVYSTIRLNGELDLQGSDGTKYRATLQNINVGPLIDLIMSHGPQNTYTWGRTYSPLTLVQYLMDEQGGAILDTTLLYTALTVVMAMPATP